MKLRQTCILTNSPQTYLRNQHLITFDKIALSKNHKKPLKRCIGTEKETNKDRQNSVYARANSLSLFLSWTHM